MDKWLPNEINDDFDSPDFYGLDFDEVDDIYNLDEFDDIDEIEYQSQHRNHKERRKLRFDEGNVVSRRKRVRQKPYGSWHE